MSYQVLARKWRPRTFDEVVGQAHVTTALRNAIRSGRIPHALLLTGPRGTGKTTLARIFACCLNAEKGPTESPDPEDPSCREIAAGTSTDVQEVDAASRTSVDDVREIIESIRYAASPGKYRIYIVDEVHMFSTSAFNALLKTLEEPPPRSLFIFCTTNPEKIPFTVVSRCQRYDLRRIPSAEVAAKLGEIAASEGIAISPQSLAAVARAGEGSLRDATTLLDQLVAFGGNQVDDARVAEVLDLIDRRVLVAVVEACVDGNAQGALEAARRAWESGVDARRLGAALLSTLRDLVVFRIAPDAGLVEGSDAELEVLGGLARRAEEGRLRRMFRALLREQEDLAWAPDPFSVLEMALVRLATMASGDQVDQLLSRIDALERRLAEGAPSGGDGGGGGTAPDRAPEPSHALGRRSARSGRGGPRGSRVDPSPGSAGPAAPADPLPGSAAPPAPEAPLPVVFDRLRAFAQEANRGLFASLEGGRLLACGDGELRIALPSALAARRMEARRPELEEVCGRFFGGSVRVLLEAPAAPEATPLAPRSREGEAQEVRRRRLAALGHPAVNDALEILGAEILEIRPLGAAGEDR